MLKHFLAVLLVFCTCCPQCFEGNVPVVVVPMLGSFVDFSDVPKRIVVKERPLDDVIPLLASPKKQRSIQFGLFEGEGT